MSYTKYHFEQEEKLMKFYQFPGMDIHVQEHNKFIDFLNNLNYNEMNMEQEKTITELTRFVSSWVFKHIMDTDFKYSDYIIEAMKSE